MKKEERREEHIEVRRDAPGEELTPGEGPSLQDEMLRLKMTLYRALVRLQLWKEGILFGAVVLLVLGAYAVWAVIMLSGGYPEEVRERATTFISHLSSALLGLVAGKAVWKE